MRIALFFSLLSIASVSAFGGISFGNYDPTGGRISALGKSPNDAGAQLGGFKGQVAPDQIATKSIAKRTTSLVKQSATSTSTRKVSPTPTSTSTRKVLPTPPNVKMGGPKPPKV